MGPLHSIYVDQWDWEKVITEKQRTMATLKDAMQRIITAIGIPTTCSSGAFRNLQLILSGKQALLPPKNWKICIRTKPPRNGNTCLPRNTVQPVFCKLAISSSLASPMTAVPPTMTIGRSTATFSYGTKQFKRLLKSVPWAFVSAPKASKASLKNQAASTVKSSSTVPASRRAALHHWRRYRPKQNVYGALRKASYRRSAIFLLSEAIRTARDESGIFLL